VDATPLLCIIILYSSGTCSVRIQSSVYQLFMNFSTTVYSVSGEGLYNIPFDTMPVSKLRNSVLEVSLLLRYDTKSLGSWFATFQDSCFVSNRLEPVSQ
jgi:hypothetical protein